MQHGGIRWDSFRCKEPRPCDWILLAASAPYHRKNTLAAPLRPILGASRGIRYAWASLLCPHQEYIIELYHLSLPLLCPTYHTSQSPERLRKKQSFPYAATDQHVTVGPQSSRQLAENPDQLRQQPAVVAPELSAGDAPIPVVDQDAKTGPEMVGAEDPTDDSFLPKKNVFERFVDKIRGK